jgi:hypothetical protein
MDDIPASRQFNIYVPDEYVEGRRTVERIFKSDTSATIGKTSQRPSHRDPEEGPSGGSSVITIDVGYTNYFIPKNPPPDGIVNASETCQVTVTYSNAVRTFECRVDGWIDVAFYESTNRDAARAFQPDGPRNNRANMTDRQRHDASALKGALLSSSRRCRECTIRSTEIRPISRPRWATGSTRGALSSYCAKPL